APWPRSRQRPWTRTPPWWSAPMRTTRTTPPEVPTNSLAHWTNSGSRSKADAAWTPAHRPAASPTCCSAAALPWWWPPMSAGACGVVRDPDQRADAVLTVITRAGALGLAPQGVVASPLPGPSGNVEYFVWFRRGKSPRPDDVAEMVRAAVRKGPQ